uniref:NHS-like 2 n=1 Tax=Neogobius melanostomus TaxID=47308 RepID=A0A8C6TQW0_9GOBI
MPFCKRTILPRDVCKPLHGEARPREELYVHLGDVCGFTLCSVLRQLADVSRHGVGILEELQGELASVVHPYSWLWPVLLFFRLCGLCGLLAPEQESIRASSSSLSGGGGANANRGAHFRSPWQQSVNVFGSWNRPECVEELHQQAQLNLQSLLQGKDEETLSTKMLGNVIFFFFLMKGKGRISQMGFRFESEMFGQAARRCSGTLKPLFKCPLFPPDNTPDRRSKELLHPVAMDHSGLLCSTSPSSSWNGPKGSTFSPGAWNEPYNSNNYHSSTNKGPAVPPKQHTIIGGTIQSVHSEHRPPIGKRSETEGGEASRGRQRSARSIAAANAFKFRERSLSTPTDSDSFGFDGRMGESYALMYPSGSSEDSASTADTISMAASDYSNESRLRLRSPVDFVEEVEAQTASLLQMSLNTLSELSSCLFPGPRSLSGSSTATGTTVIECMKVRGSSESLLDSPSTSRATSPSLLSAEPENKASSPFRPHGLMSPSSGYSSQSEAPTPTVPHNHGTGHGMLTGCRMRPKIPERKSSLPSPKDPAARSRLSFEMPGNAHLELSSIKPKQKASRRHSDTSTAEKPGKISPSSSQALPVVTQNELKTIRLRSVSRGDLEDCPDGAKTQARHRLCPNRGPPVAIKPPLPKRPMNLQLKPPSPSSTSLSTDSPPGSPVDRPVPLGNIYKVMRKPKPKKPPPQVPDVNSNTIQNASYESQFIPRLRSGEKTVLHIAEEADDDVLTSTASSHTTEDLFTIIHRSKRKVLGRKEPTDSFGSRQNLSSSPVKHNTSSSDLRSYTLGGAQRSSSSRNENFMALLQKKGSKSSGGGTRVSAMELLKSTNPLARRVTEFSTTPNDEAESGNGTNH